MVIQLFNWDRREKHPISIKTHLEFDQKLAWKTWKKPGISCEVHAENPDHFKVILEPKRSNLTVISIYSCHTSKDRYSRDKQSGTAFLYAGVDAT